MTAAPQPASPSVVGVGLLERLLAAVRPEFRVELLLPDQNDPVLGWTACAVPGCDRPGHDWKLCRGMAYGGESRAAGIGPPSWPTLDRRCAGGPSRAIAP